MWPYYPDLLATPVPRYTSYPTAAEFGAEVGAADFGNALETAVGDVSLYLHIPFCETICWYCGCNTSRANRRDRLTSYLDALHREIAVVGAHLPETAAIKHIAFGGGSPNAIAPTDFVRLMLSLTHAFRLSAPSISIELDPRSMTSAWADALAGVGVTRASLGVQTFEPALQQAIGRKQPAHLIEECTALLRKAGVTSLNFDLMYGLPGQELDHLEATLERAISLGPNRIALFGYAHVPHLISRQQQIDASALPDLRTRFDMAALGHRKLLQAGYSPVGFDHFALPGDPLAQAALSGRLHRNFQGFTDDAAPTLIGLGASAISSFPQLLVQNEKNAGRYRMMLSQDRFAATRGVRRSSEDRKRAGIIESLLCTGRALIDETMLAEASERLAPFAGKSLIEMSDGELRLKGDAIPYARAIAATFDPYRAAVGKQFSSAV
jgi:oxygen-independent coproporphyrinogen-3 oxidase